MARTGVRVEGLRELRRELRAIDRQLPQEVRRLNREVGQRIVLPEAQRRARQSRTTVKGRRTHLGGRGVATIRVTASQGRAQLVGGGARAPYYAGHEWGSRGAYPQFPIANRGGYILYPAVAAKREEIVEAYGDGLEALMRRVFH